jgi:hypothetical protein
MIMYRLRVVEKQGQKSDGDGGLTMDVHPDTTVLEVMRFICREWLNKYVRPGDGHINDHLWKIYRPVPPSPLLRSRYTDKQQKKIEKEDNGENRYKFYDIQEEFENAEDDWLDVQSEKDRGMPHHQMLRDISGFSEPGACLCGEYDFGTTTDFFVHLVSVESSSGEQDVRSPRKVPSAADEAANNFLPYTPPHGSQNLDNVFPTVNRKLFKKKKDNWICPFPTSPSSAGFAEDGTGSDLVFMPLEFSSLFEASVAMETSMIKFPKDNYSRLAFPSVMSEEDEAHYLREEQRVNEFLEYQERQKNGEEVDEETLSDYVRYHMWCPQIRVVLRVTNEDMTKYTSAKIEESFPFCTKAYKKGLWASYRRGKVIVSKKKSEREIPISERGIPNEVLAQVAVEIDSLNQFFCVCETLFRRIDADRIFASIKATSVTAPNLLAS